MDMLSRHCHLLIDGWAEYLTPDISCKDFFFRKVISNNIILHCSKEKNTSNLLLSNKITHIQIQV